MIRLGPNKTAISGLFQPLLDALKLFTKQVVVPSYSNKFTYSLSPLLALFMSLFI